MEGLGQRKWSTKIRKLQKVGSGRLPASYAIRMVFSRSVFSNIVPDIVFFIFLMFTSSLIRSSLLHRRCFYHPHKGFYKEKMFFLLIKILFSLVVSHLRSHQLATIMSAHTTITPLSLKKEKNNSYSIHWKIRLRRKKPSGRVGQP